MLADIGFGLLGEREEQILKARDMLVQLDDSEPALDQRDRKCGDRLLVLGSDRKTKFVIISAENHSRLRGAHGGGAPVIGRMQPPRSRGSALEVGECSLV